MKETSMQGIPHMFIIRSRSLILDLAVIFGCLPRINVEA
jgi:hypothetical protein